MAKVEETADDKRRPCSMATFHLLEVFMVIFVVNGPISVLVGKVLENEWDIICIEDQLSQVLKLEYVCANQNNVPFLVH